MCPDRIDFAVSDDVLKKGLLSIYEAQKCPCRTELHAINQDLCPLYFDKSKICIISDCTL